MIINKHLATCLSGRSKLFFSSWNIHYNCWQSEIKFLISQTVLKKILSLKMFYPVQVYALLKTLLWVATAGYNLFITSSTSYADGYLLAICHSPKPCFTRNIFRVDEICKNLIKSLGFFFAFTDEKSSVILREQKMAAKICNMTDWQKMFDLFFLCIHLASH